MSLDRIKKEEAELDKLYYHAEEENLSGGTETPSTEEPVVEESTNLEVNANDTSEVTTRETVEESEQSKPRTNWKKRYTNFKATTDTTLYNQRRTITDLEAKILSLQEQVAKLSVKEPIDVYKDVITAEDEDLIGPDAIQIVKKATEAATAPLRNELADRKREDLKQKRQRLEEDTRKSNEQFARRVASLVDNFKEINVDPKFMEFLSYPDGITGVERKVFFDKAVLSGDYVRVADFYKEFAGAKSPSKETILGKKVTPVGDSTEVVSDTPKVKTYTIDEYNQTYDTFMKGAYKSQKAKKELQNKMDLLDKAYVEGRIR